NPRRGRQGPRSRRVPSAPGAACRCSRRSPPPRRQLGELLPQPEAALPALALLPAHPVRREGLVGMRDDRPLPKLRAEGAVELRVRLPPLIIAKVIALDDQQSAERREGLEHDPSV